MPRPGPRGLITSFPLAIRAFHTDNDSKYINRRVAEFLDKLHIDEFTRFRPRRSHDNALVESRNGSIVRR